MNGIMTLPQLVIFSILLTIIEMVSVLLVYAFIRAKGKGLRKLLIIYFSIDIWNYIALVMYVLNYIDLLTYLTITLIPKAAIKLAIFLFLNRLRHEEINK